MEEIVLKTQVDARFKRKILLKGSFISFLGCLLLFVAGVFFPIHILSAFGIPIFFIGILMIRWGIGPYRKISKQELFPNELIFTKKTLSYRIQNQNAFSIPLNALKQIQFSSCKTTYGIKVLLNIPFSEKILLHNPRFNIRKFHTQSQKRFRCDFFFPFFYEKTFRGLEKFGPLLEKSILQFDEKI